MTNASGGQVSAPMAMDAADAGDGEVTVVTKPGLVKVAGSASRSSGVK